MKKPIEKVMGGLRLQNSKVVEMNGYYQAQCPAHDDKNPSLTIKEDITGKVSITCHAGCTGEQVMNAMGLSLRDLYVDDASYSKKEPKVIDAIYHYRDERDQVLYEAVRYHPKEFTFRVPLGNGKYQWSLKGVRLVLYNLPEVLKAIAEERRIYIVEGEKDADTLIELGLTATTNPMGAGKWKQEYSETLKNSNVVLIPDNDEPGFKHMQSIGAQLKGVAKSVKLITLTGLHDKQDISDWLKEGHTIKELEDLSSQQQEFNGEDSSLPVKTESKEPYFVSNYKIYSNEPDPKLVADFTIDIESIVDDVELGRFFYVTLKERINGIVNVKKQLEINPVCLDDVRAFQKVIRPYSMGIIYSTRYNPIKPIKILKWLIDKYPKPIVKRPDHIGLIHSRNQKRPFWMFENALICPPFANNGALIVPKNESGEFIVDNKNGFRLPSYSNEVEMSDLVPVINTEQDGLEDFVKTFHKKLITVIGGGDLSGKAINIGKILLGYVIYLLYEKELYHAHDPSGHTVMLYVYGPKGTGKSTYFNTILRAIFGLHRTKELKGNTVSTAALENQIGHFSQLPVCYDEYNPDHSKIDYQALNSYYHRTGRTVSDTERKGRNKFTPIRGSIVITSNFQIDLERDQADATESRMIYLEYLKDYRSNDQELFGWFEKNLEQLSRFTLYVLLTQTDSKRRDLKANYKNRFKQLELRLTELANEQPKIYEVENRLIDNYARVLSSYELIFGADQDFQEYIFEHLKNRFIQSKSDKMDNRVLNKLIHLANAGKIEHGWHYYYSTSEDSVFVNVNQVYEIFKESIKDFRISQRDFKEILKNLFNEAGDYNVTTKRWNNSSDIIVGNQPIKKSKTVYSHVLKREHVLKDKILSQIFVEP